ncbi:MAG: hypothetical protein HGA97_01855 [Chlorobiaceae bacterium]|nr:hypothetical protein [Chlorobiaceae bacterium]
MKGHQALEKSCFNCHRPFAGTSQQCSQCHKPADIGIKNSEGRLLTVKNSKAIFHKALPETSCVRCHTDHKGRQPKYTMKTFSHDSLPAELKNNCIACHNDRKPNDTLHRTVSNACASCHSTDNWKRAVFDHTVLARSLQTCVACHKKETPNDGLHRQVTDGCSGCHGTTAWKPARFNHDRYFLLDRDHRATCATCHTIPGNYKAYTCMNCHEHSPSRMASEHLEEGIGNYNNCIKCHRSASEGGEGYERHRYEGEGDD